MQCSQLRLHLHKAIGLTPAALESFQVCCLLRVADISMRMPPLRCLPILLPLLHCLCTITPSLGALGLALHVCFNFRFFVMLRQSNLVPPSTAQFDPSWATCRGGHHHDSRRSSDPHLVDQDASVGRAGTSPPYTGSARTPHRPGCSLPSSPRYFAHHISGSTPSNLSSPGVSHYGHCLHPVLSPSRPPP